MADATPSSPHVLTLALAGGGAEALHVMRALDTPSVEYLDIRVLGIADPDPRAVARLEGERLGIRTLDDPRELVSLGPLDFIVDLTGDAEVRAHLIAHKRVETGLLDRTATLRLGELAAFLKQRERENHLERTFAHTLTRATDEGVLVLDRDYRIQRINEPASRLAGLTPEQARGCYCYEVLRQATAPCQGLDAPCPMLETLSTGRSAHAIQEQIQADGQPRYSDVTTYPLVDREGNVVQVLEIFRDITSDLSERLEARTRTIKNDLSRLVQEDKLIALGKLVASVAHEINNPIGSILNFSLLLERSLGEVELPPDVRADWERWLELTVSEARRCGQIVGNLLSFSRQQGVEAREIDLVSLVRQIIQLTGHQMELSGVTLREELPDAPLPIWGDPTPIQQCISNLVFNALEAMAAGGTLTIRGGVGDPEAEAADTAAADAAGSDTAGSDTTASDTTASDTTASDTTASDTTASDTTAADTTAADTTAAETEAAAGAKTAAAAQRAATGPVWLEVSDTGEGIAPEHLDHIFEPFFSTKPQGQGVGLGLSMVYGILREHDARIAVRSTPGQGATFRVTFPPLHAVAPQEVSP